ncbi:uncharacterized protein [Epargyreus clarus]|uniref:uncharacterized protein n=1 Tax=Epargyreus clarus TaxID=520877 RepID=UPI003C2D59D2
MTSLKRRSFTKTRELFHKINNYTCIMGLLNFWGADVHVPRISTNPCYIYFCKFINIFILMLVLMEISAIFKVGEFDAKQTSDWIVLALTDPIFYSLYLSVIYYKSKVKDLLVCLTVMLKNVYNDEIIEQRMVKRVKIYMIVFLLLCFLTLALYGIDGLIQVIRLGTILFIFIFIYKF